MNDFSKPTSPQRDELAREIFIADNSGQSREASLKDWEAYAPGEYAYTYAIADGLIAAGWTKPRTITTYAELDAMAIDAVVMSETLAYQNYGAGSWAADGRFYDTGQITLPAVVLWEPAP